MQSLSRRQLIRLGLCATSCLVLPKQVWAGPSPRALSFFNKHTGESLQLTYSAHGQYVPLALEKLNHFMRDHRTGDLHPIEPQLFDQLYVLQQKMGTAGAYHVISGYRSPRTNQMLNAHSDGVAKGSLHMQGRAIDICLPGKDLAQLHKAAKSMQAGGVGYYPQSNFIHLDVGRVRYWG